MREAAVAGPEAVAPATLAEEIAEAIPEVK
jgi:hypothetical protein